MNNLFFKITLSLQVAILALLVVLCVNYSSSTIKNSSINLGSEPFLVLIDVGHGGMDAGKVGSYSLEKDINLSIAKKLSKLLSENNMLHILTRENNQGITKENEEWDKNVDMKLRREMIDTSSASIFISIHQNSFTDSTCRGSQVFYSDCLKTNFTLAQLMQDELKKINKVPSKRAPLLNNELYLLRNNDMPSVLIECGFLSNKIEEDLLNNQEYQEEIAKAIFTGICRFVK